MTTLTVIPPRERSSRIFRQLGVLVFLAALGAVITLLVYFYSVARAALPQLDGVVRVPGLSAQVTVSRDEHGVPTIDAANLEDLFFAQGYVTAQDRLWQMDAMRRQAAGELSEILGPNLVRRDREQRILGLRAVARRSVELGPLRDRQFIRAYARGVNAYLAADRRHLPIEFRILRYAPKPWTAEDCALVAANMIKDLSHGYYRAALQKEKILAKLGPELTGDLYVNSSWHDRPPLKGPGRMDIRQEDDSEAPEENAVTEMAPVFPSPLAERDDALNLFRPGSNNWVLSGSHTVSGKPLLSNDMHLVHQMPNLWYEVHLRSASFDVIGVSLPGLPFVIVGHNPRIAWGFTNSGATVEDLYVETFNDQGQYLTPQGWRDPEHRREILHIKGEADQIMDVASTRHGPIISELIPGEKRQIALRWTAYDGIRNPFFDVDAAENWTAFTRALTGFAGPSQNAVYGDVDGHIGYHATGNIPLRASGDGSLPHNGSLDLNEWTGYVPFAKLPNVFDPPWGVIATANGRITPDKYPYTLASEWGSPWRTERIYHVLESGKKFSSADMLALQTDVYSAFDRFCAERFVYALDHVSQLSARARQARDLMRDWDGRLVKESAAATLENRSREELVRLLLEPKLGAESEAGSVSWRDYQWFMSSVWLEEVLVKQPRRWLPANCANYDALLASAVEAAVQEPSAPPNLNQWRWGRAAPLYIQHPVLGRFPLIRRWAGPGLVEQAGNGYTVKQAGRNLGPSERMTVDLSDFDQTTLNTVTGQAGNFLSPYYMDQWTAWYEGTTFTAPYSPAAVAGTRKHRLVIEPF